MTPTIVIKIAIGNAAFEEYGPHEVARILRDLADVYNDRSDFSLSRKLYDINGNSVGSADLHERP